MQIREMTANDIDLTKLMVQNSINSISEKYYSKEVKEDWSSRISKRFLKEGIGELFVAVSDDTVLGCIRVESNHVSSLHVDPSFQNKGIGTKLTKFAEELVKTKYNIITLNSSLNAIEFYTSLGYIQDELVVFEEIFPVMKMHKFFS